MSGYPSGFWITAKGEKIAIKDLTNSHLLNIKRFIERLADKGVPIISGFSDCFGTEGDVDFIYEEDVKEYLNYNEICKEIKRRGLL